MAARAKIYEIAFQIGGKLEKSFSGSMLNARKNLDLLNRQVSKLESNKAGVDKFRRLKKSVLETESALRSAQDEVSRMARELKATSRPTKTMTNNFERARKKANRLKKKLLEERTAVAMLHRSMGQAGISTRHLASDSARLESSLNKARVAQQRLNSIMMKQKANMRTREQKRGELFDAAAIGASTILPGTFAARFEQGMSEVKAISQATENEMVSLTAKARELGAATSFSATQAAGGMKYLAMAGFKTNQIISAMPGILSLARAGATDLAQTSDIASNILSGFSLKAGQMNRVADVLTKTFTTSNVNLEELGETMKYVAPVATKAGVSLEQVASMAGLLGNVGIKGSEGGTALRAMILRLAAPTGEAATALSDLGIDARDAEGNIRPMIQLLGQVAKSMNDMGSGEQLEVLKKIFGERPAAAVSELIAKEGEKGITEYLKVVMAYQGASKKTAQIMNDNLIGSLKRLGSAGEGLAISTVNSLIPTLRTVIDTGSYLTSRLILLTNRFPTMTKAAGLTVVGLTALGISVTAGGYAFTFLSGGVLGAVKMFRMLQAACLLTRGQLLVLAIQQKAAAAATGIMTAAQWALNVALNANPIGLVVAGVAALAGAAYLVYKKWEPIKLFFTGLWEKLVKMFSMFGKIKRFIPWLNKEDKNKAPALDENRLKAVAGKQTGNIKLTLAPNIKVAAGVDATQVRQAVHEGMEKTAMNMRRVLEEIKEHERRLSYA